MTTPYGEWETPIDAETVAGDAISFGGLHVDGSDAYWLERRPSEGGRGVIVREGDGEPVDVTPEGYNVRTLVHEYGGGDFLAADGTVWFSNLDDQRLYRQEIDGTSGSEANPTATEPEPITPEPPAEKAHRYADADLAPDGERLYCVRERHEGDDEPTNELVAVPADGSGEPTVVADGHDFYSFPRVSPDGDRIAWTTWDHPAMPWDETALRVARIEENCSLRDERVVLGGDEESVFQPRWGPDGELYAVSDRTGWWNLYRVPIDGGEPEALAPADAEFGVPQWGFDLSTYAFLDDGTIAMIVGEGGRQRLQLLDPDGERREAELPYEAFPRPYLRSTGDGIAVVAAGPTTPPSVVRWTPGGEPSVLRRAFSIDVADGYLPRPEGIAFPTTDGETAYAHYYPPHNPDATAPDGELPPLIVTCHGGPTGEALPTLSLETAFWTSRGFAVADVNYRGSSGFGRAYRDRLDGEWGIVDVADCVNAARSLADEGRVDPDRLAVTGGSAGGYVTLCALAFHDAFDAGASHYGVADLEALAEHTHKFESRYLDGLVGPLPDAEERYRERSPLYHADGIDAPLLLLQGSEDAVVPPEQARTMIDALAESGVSHACIEFEGERHGFRRADSRTRALTAELAFYAETFDLDPADEPEPVGLSAEPDVTVFDAE